MKKTNTEKAGGMHILRYSGVLFFGILLGLEVFHPYELPPAESTGRMVRAGLDDIFPLIIGAIWIIAQIAGSAAKKKKPSPSFGRKPQDQPKPAEWPAREQQPKKEDPIGDFIRQFAGGEEFRAPEPKIIEELPEESLYQPATAHPTEIKAKEINALPDMSRSNTRKAKILPIDQKSQISKAIKEIEEIKAEIHPKMSAFSNSVPIIKLPSMPSTSLRMNSPSYAEASHGKQGIGDKLHLKDRQALRRAMLSHIIFSPPKTLERNG